MIESFTDELLNIATNETWENLKYIAQHKKHLYTGGREIDLPRVQLLAHDLSKLLPSEFLTYKRYWWGDRTPEVEEEFNDAVKKHYGRNEHHPEHWGQDAQDQMPDERLLEMVVDWYSAGRTQGTHGFKSFRSWYEENRDKLKINDDLRREIDSRL